MPSHEPQPDRLALGPTITAVALSWALAAFLGAVDMPGTVAIVVASVASLVAVY
jgi:hypothetical protein